LGYDAPMIRIACIAVLLLGLVAPALAQSPEEAGLSSSGLKRLADRLNEGVAKGEIPGAVVLVARNGKIAMFEAFGYRDRDAAAPMQKDAIFRIASMTKPITSVSAMMLVEEGKLSLDDPVAKYIPAFGDAKVAVKRENTDGTEEVGQEPQRRQMTILDLLRHTSGLTTGGAGMNGVRQSYLSMRVMEADLTNAEMVDRLARLALLYQPGTRWEYSLSTDVLGRVIEIASGLPLERFIEERIARPLKLVDTGFEVSVAKKDRGAHPQKEGPRNLVPPIPDVTWTATLKSGGEGLVSTAADYARFLQMLMNGGELDGLRLLSAKTVERMTSNQLPPDIKMGDDMHLLGEMEPSPQVGQGFGLGFAVRTASGLNPMPGSVGDYHWSGAWGTYFWSDPREHLYAVFMMHAPAARQTYRILLRELVYQGLVK